MIKFLSIILLLSGCTSSDVKSVRKEMKEHDEYIQEMYKQNPYLFEAAQVLSQ